MGIVASIVVFAIIWWTVIFTVLPFHARQPDQQMEGAMPGAPVKPDFKKILIRTTLISIVLWGIVFALAESDLISFRRWVKDEPLEYIK